MSEKEDCETVTVTTQIPKKLLTILEQEDYFDWSKDDFFVVSIQRSISCELGTMNFSEMKKLQEKYGSDLGEVVFTTRKVLATA